MITAASMPKVLWMVIYINGHVAGVFLDEPMPAYMSMEDCKASALMHTMGRPKYSKVRYTCEYHYGKPVNTGPYYRPLE